MRNRETWLNAAAERLRERVGFEGTPLVSVGFPSKSALSRKRKRIGECWDFGPDKPRHVFISPLLADPVEVVSTLIHELIHVKVGKAAKHGAAFKREAIRVGLEGKMAHTTASDDLVQFIKDVMLEALGPYPHEELKPPEREDKQSTRLLKVSCPRCHDGENKHYTARMTRKWLDELGAPICPGCSEKMEEDKNEQDRF